MATDTRTLEVQLKGNTADLEKALGRVSGATKDGGASFTKMAGAFAAGQAIFAAASAGINMVTGFINDSIKAAEESENVQTQLGAVLKSTGEKAGVSADMATKLSTSLQKVTSYSDEAVLGAENMLLTFTNIGKKVFPDATKAVLDMSTAMGTDLKSTSIQVGKALQDPINGVTSLQRVGVRLTDDQKKLVEQMVKTGNVAGAQGVILKELQTEFGGSAEAAGKTFAGSLARLQNQFNDLQEVIGAKVIGVLAKFTGHIANFVSSDAFQAWFTKATDVMGKFIDKLFSFAQAAWPVVKKAFQEVGVIIQTYVIPFLHSAADEAGRLFETSKPFLKEALKQIQSTIKDWVIPALQAAKLAIEGAFKAGSEAIQNFQSNFPKLAEIIPIIAAIGIAFMVNPAVTVIAGIIAGIVLLHQHWQQVVTFFQQGWATINTAIAPIMPLLKFLGDTVFQNVIQPLLNLGITIYTQLLPALMNLWNVLAPVLIPVLKTLGIIIGATLVAAFVVIAAAIKVFADILRNIVAVLSIVINAVAGFIALLTGNFNAIPRILHSILDNVGDIITAPFRNAFNTIKGGVGEVVNKLKDLNPFQKHSPSLVELVTGGTNAISRQYGNMFSDLKNMSKGMRATDLGQPLVPQPQQVQSPQQNINISISGDFRSAEDQANLGQQLTQQLRMATRGI